MEPHLNSQRTRNSERDPKRSLPHYYNNRKREVIQVIAETNDSSKMSSKEEVEEQQQQQQQHGIVIVGGGICGVATAVALHRKGISCLVLEKSETLRAAGLAIGIQANGWRALDQLRVGDILRAKAIPLTEIRNVSLQSSRTTITRCRAEFRYLKRSDLIEALANNIPEDSIWFGCQIERVEVDPLTSFPLLYTSDGAIIRAKVVIGCDGSNSVVARALGVQAPKAFKSWVIRGFTVYEEGHNFPANLLRLLGNHRVLGRVPIDDKLVHWFLEVMSPPEGEEVYRDHRRIKPYALDCISGYPPVVVEMVKNCDLGSLNLTINRYRAPWHLLTGNLWNGTMTVAGDAMHVMGPFIGQGGSAGLEDSVVLARCLGKEMPLGMGDMMSDLEVRKGVGAAFKRYVKERRLRVVRLSTQTYIVGTWITSSSGFLKLMCSVILIVFFGGTSLGHTRFDCGTL